MKIDVRRVARKAFRRLGYQRRIAPSFVEVMERHQVDVVLDIGANDGDYGREIRDAGYRGKIVSFEPNPVVFERLKGFAERDGNWDVFQLGVGDSAGHLDLSVTKDDVFGSFKRPSDYGRGFSGTTEVRSVRVEVVRLDAFLAAHPHYARRAYLKVDTQGFEMEVLRGTGDILSSLAAVQLEIGLLRIYADQEDWLVVLDWMRRRGFEVATVVCNSADKAQAQIIELDTVFVQRAA